MINYQINNNKNHFRDKSIKRIQYLKFIIIIKFYFGLHTITKEIICKIKNILIK